MKKVLLLFVIILGMGFAFYIYYNQTNPVVNSSQAKLKLYVNSLEELEANSDLIVTAKVNGQPQNNTKYDKEKIPYAGYTVTPIEILKIHKGQDALGGSKNLLIREEYYTFTVPSGKKFLTTVEGYKPLSKDKKYILFLNKTPKSNIYSCVGVYQGKYVLNRRGTSLNELDIYSNNRIEIYKRICEEVNKKYSE